MQPCRIHVLTQGSYRTEGGVRSDSTTCLRQSYPNLSEQISALCFHVSGRAVVQGYPTYTP